ncbi:MAG: phosphoenolpyruvate synthase [Deltaproteobacteria bacterium]|nr:phosphoenolpyruvate synthase [Deltaproteobacteria bacterium]
MPFVLPFAQLKLSDVPRVGGKNAALGEMIGALVAQGIRVPGGFAVDADAYRHFLRENDLEPRMATLLAELKKGARPLASTGAALRSLLNTAKMPDDLQRAVTDAYRAMSKESAQDDLSVAVRSSATAEDLPEASFAGQQETFLNVRGAADVVAAYQRCLASLFTDRAIAYRDEHGFDHMKVALSVGVQRMVRSDVGAAGVMFTLDTESGSENVVLVHAAWGLGENVVKGAIGPDEYLIFKPALGDPKKAPIVKKTLGTKERTMVFAQGGHAMTRDTETPIARRARFAIDDADALQLARWALTIERHMSELRGHPVPMDIEWAKDGVTNELFIVQARPETVRSRQGATMKRFKLTQKGKEIVHGAAVGDGIAAAPVCVVKGVTDLQRFPVGAVLVAEMTDPDWVPAMRKASGIVTEHGGRTCHAAIVSRELGIPAVVGANDATRLLQEGQLVTISCAEGERGVVYDGKLSFQVEEVALGEVTPTKTKVMMNLADPSTALRHWRLPVDGIGLARMEFIITDDVRVHPMALCRFDQVTDPAARKEIEALTAGYPDKGHYFVEHLSRGIGMLAASVWPKPIVLRMSDFKTNEYASLVGGAAFEPKEENPMIGFRGASRYADARYRPGFALECKAVTRVRTELGLDNVIVMIPFVRTLDEADRVLAVMKEEGLERGKNGLLVYMMCEIPSNVILAEEFSARFDGFSIGSNDLTQLTLGVDRDSEILAPLFSEKNEAVVRLIKDFIKRAHACGRPVGICGQAPSDHPDFAEMLVEAGIDSISLNPDSVVQTRKRIAICEERLGKR